MRDMKKWLNDTVEHVTKNLVENSACAFFWGEVEMPNCLCEEIGNGRCTENQMRQNQLIVDVLR